MLSTAKVISRRGTLAFLSAAAGIATMGTSARGDELTAFRDEVLDVSHRHYPALPLIEGADVEEVRSGAFRLYLGNLHATVRGLDRKQREDAIVKWIGALKLQARGDDPTATATDAWGAARPLLRPKLIPADYLKQAAILVHNPFFSGLRIGYGLDLGQKDEFVTESKLAKWGVPLTQVHESAVANLEAMSEDIVIEPKSSATGRGHYAAIQKGDAYDAARILLPKLRTRLIAALGGSPVFAGIPNRDFLIAWSPDLSARHKFIAKIHEDAQTQPYPLTADIFRLTPEAVRLATAEDLNQ